MKFGGALGTQTGEHRDPLDASGSKFYTVGRARFKPHQSPLQVDVVDYLKVLPLPLYIVNATFPELDVLTMTEISNRWRTAVDANLLAHSDMTLHTSVDKIHDVYTFDVKLMAQKPVIQKKDKDINGDLSRADAIEKLRILRTRLVRVLGDEILRKMFVGYKSRNVTPPNSAADNPFLDPFSDMTADDFAMPGDVRSHFFYGGPNNDDVFFHIGSRRVTAIDVMYDDDSSEILTGGAKRGGDSDDEDRPEDRSWFLRLSSFHGAYSKFFGYAKLDEYISRYTLFATSDAFAFVDPDKNLVKAYGWTSTMHGMSLLKRVARELGVTTMRAIVPTIAPAHSHGHQDCIRTAWIDLDILKPFVKYLDATIQYPVPALSADFVLLTRKKKRSKYAMMYAAARCSEGAAVETVLCEDTGTPHEFIISFRIESP